MDLIVLDDDPYMDALELIVDLSILCVIDYYVWAVWNM